MRLAAPFALLTGSLALVACGPIPLADAERVCLEDADAATGPKGRVGVGVASSGDGFYPAGRFEVSVSSDYIRGRDPAEVFAACVQRRSGQPPSRPLYDQPGWAGK
ncbi:MAG: hypothetical protein ACK5II_04325 [Paracoccus sp. (in: a-proteobacteria)]